MTSPRAYADDQFAEHDCDLIWNDQLNNRRGDLIDKDIQSEITDDERRELDALTAQFRAYRRRVAPIPIEGALRLHAELLEKSRRRNGKEGG